MITGFNTDVKHRNRVFHIQTEDKGEANPYVESLVYVGGEILATKRTSYAEVIKTSGRDDHAVQDLMEQQHRTMIAAIQRGRFDGPNGAIQIPEGMSPSAAPETPAKAERPSKKVKDDPTAPPGTDAPIPMDRSLDQMILDYLVSDEVPEEVEVSAVADARLHRRAFGPDQAQGRFGLAVAPARRGDRSGPHPLHLGPRLDRLPGQDRLGRVLPDLLHGALAPQRHGGRRHPRHVARRHRRGAVPDQEEMSAEMHVTVNGEGRVARREPPSRISSNASEWPARAIAVERNKDIVPKAEYGATALAEGDVFEVVELVGGG